MDKPGEADTMRLRRSVHWMIILGRDIGKREKEWMNNEDNQGGETEFVAHSSLTRLDMFDLNFGKENVTSVEDSKVSPV